MSRVVEFEETACGFRVVRIENGNRTEVQIGEDQLLAFWILLGLYLDEKYDGQVDRVTKGGLAALKRAHLRRALRSISIEGLVQ